MIEKHLFTSDDKLKWWGYGEWVEEPDEIRFECEGIQCHVTRFAVQEPFCKEFHMFGGYLNGYVCIPSHHPYYHKKYEDIDIAVHGGLSFGECSVGHWIGFDCAHSGDLVPSMEFLANTNPALSAIRKDRENLKERFALHNSPIFMNSYKNVNYVIEECKSIVKQLNAIKWTPDV